MARNNHRVTSGAQCGVCVCSRTRKSLKFGPLDGAMFGDQTTSETSCGG